MRVKSELIKIAPSVRAGRLTVLKRSRHTKGRMWMWLCKCDCGNVKEILGASLSTGHTKSCGCLHAETIRDRATKHGASRGRSMTPEYLTWVTMIRRCHKPRCMEFKWYGGRGIQVCERWRESFSNFLEDMGKRPDGMSLDRIDNNRNYEPGNCRWASRAQQTLNRRNVLQVTIDGVTKSAMEWGIEYGLGKKLVQARIRRGWDGVRAVKTPVTKGADRE